MISSRGDGVTLRMSWMAGLAGAGLAVVCAPLAVGADCKCRAGGQSYEQGQIRCILGKLAQCQKNQNVSTWQVIAPVCPVSEQPHAPVAVGGHGR